MMVQKIVTFDVALKSTERQWVQKIPEVYTNHEKVYERTITKSASFT